ncbi:MAG: hypothetical protein R3264_20195, partial [Anaerolineae bacterium]|nr:hypothetical protein [Anaerolineae bacterium]
MLIWGEFPIKNKPALQTKVDLTRPAFACSCFSRKFPCHHALGLMLLLLDTPQMFGQRPAPDWVSRWYSKLTRPNGYAKNGRASIKKSTKNRQANILAGLKELELWLQDMIRNGLATVHGKPKQYWFKMADRLVDAQAGELAHKVRLLADIPGSGPTWPEQLLGHLGRLHLLIQGFKNFDNLSAAQQADIRAAVGWHFRDAGPDAWPPICDWWHVLGRQVSQTGKQHVQHTWLWGQRSNRPALIHEVAVGKRSLNTTLIPGTMLEADLAYYPGTTPLRASLVTHHELRQQAGQRVRGYKTISEAIQMHARSLTANPWHITSPMMLAGVVVEQAGDDQSWRVRDEANTILPLPAAFLYGWHLRAVG